MLVDQTVSYRAIARLFDTSTMTAVGFRLLGLDGNGYDFTDAFLANLGCYGTDLEYKSGRFYFKDRSKKITDLEKIAWYGWQY